MIHEDLSRQIIGRFFDVYNGVRPGQKEVLYQRALIIALRGIGLRVESEIAFAARFRDELIGTYRVDLIVEGTAIVECKATECIHSAHVAQLLHYLKATGLPLGLLLNFGPQAKFVRRVNTLGPSDGANEIVFVRRR